MPWKETDRMSERSKFVYDFESGDYSLSELCRCYGISRPTAYKWLSRYKDGGVRALEDQSHAPHNHPNKTPQEIIDRIVELRLAKPTRGPKKLRVQLCNQYPSLNIPSVSTIGAILKREGLVPTRRRKRQATPNVTSMDLDVAPNVVWCIDFKGWFRTGDGTRCDPLTITDASSRLIICCRGFEGTRFTPKFKATMEAAFREFGLPERIRSDNGAPFASVGLAGLSKLSVWWMRLGIRPERIKPGKPQQNGRHERMHLTLKQETASPPCRTLALQQKAFDAFVKDFNEDRPHEALGQRPPWSLYQPSNRKWPTKLPELQYDEACQTRRVRGSGQMKWKGKEVLVSQALCGETIGLRQIDEHLWIVLFAGIEIGIFNERRSQVCRLRS